MDDFVVPQFRKPNLRYRSKHQNSVYPEEGSEGSAPKHTKSSFVPIESTTHPPVRVIWEKHVHMLADRSIEMGIPCHPWKSMLLSPLRLVLERIFVGEEAFLNLSPKKSLRNIAKRAMARSSNGNPETHENFDVKGNMACPININKQYHEKKYELLIPKRQEYHSRKSKGSVTWGCRPGKNGYNYQMVGKL